jgi:basic membrane protein A and related proteins
MTRHILRLLAFGLALVGLSALPAMAAFKLNGEPKIALVIFTQKNDGGWSQALDEARQRLEASMGVKIPVVENVPENATAIRPAVELLISRGFNIIIGSAFGYSDSSLNVSEFRHVQGAVGEVSGGRLPQSGGHHQRAQSRILLWAHL